MIDFENFGCFDGFIPPAGNPELRQAELAFNAQRASRSACGSPSDTMAAGGAFVAPPAARCCRSPARSRCAPALRALRLRLAPRRPPPRVERHGRPVARPRPSRSSTTLEERTFRWFWEPTDPATGLIPDRWPTRFVLERRARSASGSPPTRSASSAAGSRAGGRRAARAATTLRFLSARAAGRRARAGVTGYRGFFYHFLDMRDRRALRERRALDDRHDAAAGRRALLPELLRPRRRRPRREIRAARRLALPARRLDLGAAAAARRLAWAGRPRRASIAYDWRGYNEAMILYILALGSPTHPVDAGGVARSGRSTYAWGDLLRPGARRLRAAVRPPVLARLDRLPRHPGRRTCASTGIDYFENSRRATLAQRAYAIANPGRLRAATARDVWGLTACDGPLDGDARRSTARRARSSTYAGARRVARRRQRRRHDRADGGRRARSRSRPRSRSRRCRTMRERYGDARCCDRYGFLDAFNPTLDVARCALAARHDRAGRRLVRHRLPRHRPGADRGDDRELPLRARLAHDAQEPVHRARACGARASRADGSTRRRALTRRPVASRPRSPACAAALLARGAAACGAADAGSTLRFWALGREGEVVQRARAASSSARNPGHPRRSSSRSRGRRRTRSS